VALADRLGRGRGIQTANYYLREIKSFCRWLVNDRRLPTDPLTHPRGGNANADRRHERRALSLDELRRAVAAAKESRSTFRKLTGPDRSMLYVTAAASGFRASALASLRPENFDLARFGVATVTLGAEHAKNGRTAEQPLPPDVADALRGYLAKRPAGRPVWPGTWPDRAADMFRRDAEAAGIPYVVQGADGPLFADFHALRHSYVAMLDQTGARPAF
jgi:integrase